MQKMSDLTTTGPASSFSKTLDLASGDVIFAATGVTDGSLLRGVRRTKTHVETNSVVMRSSSGTVRWITAQHNLRRDR